MPGFAEIATDRLRMADTLAPNASVIASMCETDMK
jgi:hypothetical protein